MDGHFEEVEESKTKILKDIKDNYPKYKTPLVAFVTFATEEAHERCLHFFGGH